MEIQNSDDPAERQAQARVHALCGKLIKTFRRYEAEPNVVLSALTAVLSMTIGSQARSEAHARQIIAHAVPMIEGQVQFTMAAYGAENDAHPVLQ
jgi:hypothetical protein